MTDLDKVQRLQNVVQGVLEQALAQREAGDKVCTLGKANLRILAQSLRDCGCEDNLDLIQVMLK